MEIIDIITIVFVVFVGVALVSTFNSAYSLDDKKEHCKSHKWEQIDEKLICSVCNYKAGT